jgi:hypothetical protein
MELGYCYWDVRSYIDFIGTIINLAIAFIIAIQVAIAFRRSIKYLQPSA